MSFVVKNTTKWGLLDLLCPHICRGCGRLGTVLCDRCKNDILTMRKPICPLCKQQIAGSEKNGLAWKCKNCELPFREVFVVGWREGVLDQLIKEYKYQSVWAAGDILAELLAATISQNIAMNDVVVVPLPTIGKHVRERGLDHTLKLAKKLARKRGFSVQKVLRRKNDAVQVGAKVSERVKQAAEAYEVAGEVNPQKSYLLVDDVWTTGATMMEAAKVLQKAGAEKIFGAVLATGKAGATKNDNKKSPEN